jgi:hypothetical protein
MQCTRVVCTHERLGEGQMSKGARPVRLATAVVVGTAVSLGAAPSPPPTKAAIQSWVFDGAFQAAVTLGVAYTDSGVVSYLRDGLVCAQGDSNPIGFVSLGPAQASVYRAAPPLSFGLQLDPSFIPQPLPPAVDPALVTNDCVALQHETGVQSYIAGLKIQIDATAAQTQACVENARQLACEVLDLVPLAVTKCNETTLCDVIISGDLVEGVEGSDTPDETQGDFGSFPCHECERALSELPYLVKGATQGLAGCQKQVGDLEFWRNGLAGFLASQDQPLTNFFGGLFFTKGVGVLADRARAEVDAAESASDAVDATVESFAETSAACSHSNLVESCDACDGDTGTPPPVPLTGAVKSQLSARHLGKIATALRTEARRTTDTALRDRYTALANRLRRMPDARVLDVTAPASVPFSQNFVALRRSDLPDDGRSPLAVVMTLVRSRRCPPPLSRTDRLLLDDGWETFRRTLDPGRDCPTCPPPR